MRSVLALSVCVAAVLPSSIQAEEPIDIGLTIPYQTYVVADGLNNPSCVTFRADGALTICDSGNGKVIVVKDGKSTDYITGFATEYWKVDADTGKKRFKLGPLSAVWVDEDTLAVTNSGVGDGAETVMFYDGPGTADSGKATNPVTATTDDPKDKGEGNLTGLSISKDGSTLYLGGQGADAASWVLSVDVKSRKLQTAFSADKAGISVNSPMATIVEDDGHVLALYSGKGGTDDGLIVKWDPKAMKVVSQWALPGLTDPMGFDRMPPALGGFIVVDNNWSLTEVKDGRLAHVILPDGGGNAQVNVVADKLKGPVSCAFSPEGELYIAQLGDEFDANKGQVLKIAE
jgi:hypothetical protein